MAKIMDEVDYLHEYDSLGNQIPITRKYIGHLMKVGRIKPKVVQMQIRDINTNYFL